MGQVALEEEIYRVVGVTSDGVRRVWRYRSKPDAAWRASELDTRPDCELLEFSYAAVKWRPAPKGWWS